MQNDHGFEFSHDFSFISFSLCLTVTLWEAQFKGNHMFKENTLLGIFQQKPMDLIILVGIIKAFEMLAFM